MSRPRREMSSFAALPLWANGALLAAAALAVWIAGVRLTRYVDAIAERTGLGRAFLGALMLGGITSLPELSTTITASAIGNASLAASNILGGVVMQVTILALADATEPDRALSSIAASPAVLLQAVLFILVLAVVAAGILIGEPPALPIGLWTAGVCATGVYGFYLINRYRESGWQVAVDGGTLADERERLREEAARQAPGRLSTHGLLARTIAASVVITIAGWALAGTGDVVATQTPLGSSFVGVALVAIATSLPEVSTSLAAVRLQRYEMAFANVFGANLLDIGLLFVIDAIYEGGPILNGLGRFSLFGVALGIFLSSVYLVGLLERRNRTVFRLGIDSAVVLMSYLAGMYALYLMR